MRIFTGTIAGALLSIAAVGAAPVLAEDQAQETETQSERPAASLADMGWLAGSWEGEGIGGNPAGETFTYAGDSQMVGHFWQGDDQGGIEFYELITITPDGESLTMRLKHFTADLTGWEAKEGDAALEFPLLERGEDAWKFGPVTFTPKGDDKLDVSVKVKLDDGSLSSFDFTYDRVTQD